MWRIATVAAVRAAVRGGGGEKEIIYGKPTPCNEARLKDVLEGKFLPSMWEAERDYSYALYGGGGDGGRSKSVCARKHVEGTKASELLRRVNGEKKKEREEKEKEKQEGGYVEEWKMTRWTKVPAKVVTKWT